jgi:hypothetical protein
MRGGKLQHLLRRGSIQDAAKSLKVSCIRIGLRGASLGLPGLGFGVLCVGFSLLCSLHFNEKISTYQDPFEISSPDERAALQVAPRLGERRPASRHNTRGRPMRPRSVAGQRECSDAAAPRSFRVPCAGCSGGPPRSPSAGRAWRWPVCFTAASTTSQSPARYLDPRHQDASGRQ